MWYVVSPTLVGSRPGRVHVTVDTYGDIKSPTEMRDTAV